MRRPLRGTRPVTCGPSEPRIESEVLMPRALVSLQLAPGPVLSTNTETPRAMAGCVGCSSRRRATQSTLGIPTLRSRRARGSFSRVPSEPRSESEMAAPVVLPHLQLVPGRVLHCVLNGGLPRASRGSRIRAATIPTRGGSPTRPDLLLLQSRDLPGVEVVLDDTMEEDVGGWSTSLPVMNQKIAPDPGPRTSVAASVPISDPRARGSNPRDSDPSPRQAPRARRDRARLHLRTRASVDRRDPFRLPRSGERR